MSEAAFQRMLFEFQDGVVTPTVWLRWLANVPGLEDWVCEWIRENRPLPDGPMTKHEAQFWRPQDPPRTKLKAAEPEPAFRTNKRGQGVLL